VLVVGAPGSGQGALAESLLTAPGTWRAPEPHDVDVNGDLRGAWRAAYDAREGAADRGDAVPVPVVDATGSDVAALAAELPDARFVLVLRNPAVVLAEARARGEEEDDAVGAWGRAVGESLAALRNLPAERWRSTSVEDLVREPEAEVQRVFSWLGLGWHRAASEPWSRWPLEHPPQPLDRATAERLQEVAPLVAEVRATIEPAAPSLLPSTPEGSLTATDRGLGDLLGSIGASLLVSTYQSNRLIALRRDGSRLGVHLRAFDRPMGIAVGPDRFALGVRSSVLDYRNFPALAAGLEPKGSHDAAFLPRNTHVTGDVAIHDLEFGRDGLWLVATAFSCLATLDHDHSFVPRWRPPFVTALAPEDRCHLNGMALVDGVPRFVTALGVSDTAGGWRADKASGGVIMDVPSGEVVASGLSMPHSPRWHDGRLWFLESGKGHLSVCDPGTGAVEVVAEVPGFTRGLSFHGTTAFLGTSQIRETATFGGLPISRLPRRECGVWAVDTRSGAVLASVLFEDRIQEIFDLAVLPGTRFPEVAEEDTELTRTAWLVPSDAS
jgi:uncharacterized protein (TIGR03032 family)